MLIPKFINDALSNLPIQPPSTGIGRDQRTPIPENFSGSSKSNSVSSNGFQRFNSEYVLRDYFKDRDTFNFKYGLETGLRSNLNNSSTDNALLNLDEDPTILGFDLVILNESSLFNDMDDFFTFGVENSLKHVSNRQNLYDDFVSQFAKFFNVDDRTRGIFRTDNRFNSFKTHYINSVENLEKLIHHTGIGDEGGRQMADFGKDKLTINLSEDVGLNSGYLAGTYRNLIYDKSTGRQVIPENLLRFDMAVIISEVRNFNRVSNAAAKISSDSDQETIRVFKDNVNRYIYTLYDCQFDFNSYSFGNNITQAGFGAGAPEVSSGINMDIYYKYVGFEMEKFNFHPGSVDPSQAFLDEGKYINNQRIDPTTNQLNPDPDSDANKQTDAPNADKFPKRVIDIKFQMNTFNNSVDNPRQYEFDFPMLNPKYSRDVIDLRNAKERIEAQQTNFRRGVNTIIDRANQQLQTRFIEARSQLISGLTSKIRERTGLRNISSPTNVYQGTNLGQFVLDKVGDFSNLGLSTALSGGASHLSQLSKGAENSIFDAANRGAQKLKGFEAGSNRNSSLSSNGSQTIPNVYKK